MPPAALFALLPSCPFIHPESMPSGKITSYKPTSGYDPHIPSGADQPGDSSPFQSGSCRLIDPALGYPTTGTIVLESAN